MLITCYCQPLLQCVTYMVLNVHGRARFFCIFRDEERDKEYINSTDGTTQVYQLQKRKRLGHIISRLHINKIVEVSHLQGGWKFHHLSRNHLHLVR